MCNKTSQYPVKLLQALTMIKGEKLLLYGFKFYENQHWKQPLFQSYYEILSKLEVSNDKRKEGSNQINIL